MKRDPLDDHASTIPAECWKDGTPPKHRNETGIRLVYDPMTITAGLSGVAFLVLMLFVLGAWFGFF